MGTTQLSENNFSLTKVKMNKDGGLNVDYEAAINNGGENYSNKCHIETEELPHPDLRRAFDELRPMMATVLGMTNFENLISDVDFRANDKQKEMLQELAQNVIESIYVTGIALAGDGDNIGCTIIADLYTVSGQKVTVNSPRIKFDTGYYGFEMALEDLVAGIEKEVYDYLFAGKRAQLELFDADLNPKV